MLKSFVEGAYLDHLVKGIREMRSQGREPYGDVVPQVKEIWVSKGFAKVLDCQGISGTGMADARTHQLIPETARTKPTDNIEVEMKLASDGRWRVTGLSAKEKPCTPPSP
jgi:hypothetical protein